MSVLFTFSLLFLKNNRVMLDINRMNDNILYELVIICRSYLMNNVGIICLFLIYFV